MGFVTVAEICVVLMYTNLDTLMKTKSMKMKKN